MEGMVDPCLLSVYLESKKRLLYLCEGSVMNTLKSVFWDYPEFTDEQNLRRVLSESLSREDRRMYFWIMCRFLEHGRVVDAMRFFSIEEIARHLSDLRLTPYASAKWQRLIEVYHAA